MQLTLYATPSSHPCEAVAAALGHKGLAYERVDLLPGLAPFHQLARFGRRTVPALKIDTYKVVGSRLIMHTLDGLAPEPPLYPRDPGERAAVEEAERWGDEQLQEAARWTTIYAIAQRPESARSFTERANIPQLPDAVATPMTRAIFSGLLRVIGDGPEGARRWLRDLPGLLDHADGLVEAGTIGGEQPNAADFQIGASLALVPNFDDMRPLV